MKSCDIGGQRQSREGTQKDKEGVNIRLLEQLDKLIKYRTKNGLQIKKVTRQIEELKHRHKIRQFAKIVSALCSDESKKHGGDPEAFLNANYENPKAVFFALFDLSCRLVANIDYQFFVKTINRVSAELNEKGGRRQNLSDVVNPF